MDTWIRIHFEEIEPPRGRAELGAGPEPVTHVFSGWLGLLHALYELLDLARDGGSALLPPNPSRAER